MIPNILTTVRLVLVPIFAYLMLSGEVLFAAVVFVISGVTDVVDGYIARHFNMITNFGMVYDPFVDKLMQITAVVCLVLKEIIPLWLLVFVIAKEVTMIIVGGILYIKNIVVRSNKYGKIATVIFYAGVFMFMIWKDIPSIVSAIVIAVMISSMLIAAIHYTVDIVKNYEEKRVEADT